MDSDEHMEVGISQLQELQKKLEWARDEIKKQLAILHRLDVEVHSRPLCSWCWHLTASEEGLHWKKQPSRSFRKTQSSALRGCPLCRSILKNAKLKIRRERNVTFAYTPSAWPPRLKHFPASDRRDSSNLARGFRVLMYERSADPNTTSLAPDHSMYVGLYALPGDATSQGVAIKPRIEQPSGQFAFASVRNLLQNCSANHRCSSNPLPVLPTRVLYVGEINESDEFGIPLLPLKLHISKEEEREQYAALSYCWGGPQEVTTTRANLDSHSKEIDMTALPKTIQDAVTVTRQLRIKYLWIDALCIIQDDGPDKMREISKMGEVYQNAKITIAASRSYSVKDGFLQDHPFPDSIESQLYCGADRRRAKIWLIPQSVAEILDDPLASRGWTFQEHLLSSRILNYGSKGVTWHCEEDPVLPVLPYNVHYTLEGNNSGLAWTTFKQRTAVSRHHDDRDDRKVVEYSPSHGFWLYMVGLFSKRTLTMASDRLLAVSGIASEISKTVPPDDYLAGLWKNDLIHALGWRREATGALLPNGTAPLKNLDLPTWSWASISAPITHEFALVEIARFLRSDVRPELPSAPYGNVAGKTLILSARILRVRRRDLMLTQLPFKVALDYPNIDSECDGVHGWETIWIMQLGAVYLGGPIGLILRQISDTTMRFKRLGLFYSSHRTPNFPLRDFLSTLEMKEVEII